MEAAQQSGSFVWGVTGKRFPLLQIVTVPDRLSRREPDLPPTFLPYLRARRAQLGQRGRLDL